MDYIIITIDAVTEEVKIEGKQKSATSVFAPVSRRPSPDLMSRPSTSFDTFVPPWRYQQYCLNEEFDVEGFHDAEPITAETYDVDNLFDESDAVGRSSAPVRTVRYCPYCDKNVSQLPRHLRDVHHFDPSDALKLSHTQRKRKPLKSGQGKSCPFKECELSPAHVRLDQHLRRKHKLEPTHPIYMNNIKVKKLKVSENMLLERERETEMLECAKETEKLECAKETKIKCMRTALYTLFKKHLQSLDGGSKSISSSDCQPSKIRQILSEANVTSVKSLHETETGDKLRDYFDKILSKTVNASSMIAQVLSNETNAAIRNAILLYILRQNSSRSCPIYNMTVKEFHEAQLCNSGSYVISVSEYKTKAGHGAAEIVVTQELHFLIAFYIKYIRNSIVSQCNSSETSVFVTNAGHRLTASYFNNEIKSVWKKARKHSILSSTNLRPVTTTRVHEEHSHKAQETADHLKLTLPTATRIYQRKGKGKASGERSKFINSLNTAGSEDNLKILFSNYNIKISNLNDSSVNSADHSSHNSVLNIDSDSVKIIPSSATSTGCEINPTNIITLPPEDTRRGRTTFSLAERDIIENAFAHNIKIGRIPQLKAIRMVMRDNPNVKDIVNNRGINENQIKGCITGIVNKLARKQ